MVWPVLELNVAEVLHLLPGQVLDVQEVSCRDAVLYRRWLDDDSEVPP